MLKQARHIVRFAAGLVCLAGDDSAALRAGGSCDQCCGGQSPNACG